MAENDAQLQLDQQQYPNEPFNMKTCSKCGLAGVADAEAYCPQCGSRDLVIDSANSIRQAGSVSTIGRTLASRQRRIGAFAIDLVILVLVSGITTISGPVAAAIVFLYQLFRDYGAASIGKRVFGLKVVSLSGGPATAAQWILRNVIFVLPTVALFVPVLGFFVEGGGEFAVCALELILLLATGRRLGDRIAGTTVVSIR